MKAIIQESFVLLTLFAELLYIVIINMCTQTKTNEEKNSNKKYYDNTHLRKILAIKHLVGEGQPFSPNHLGRIKKKYILVEGESQPFISELLKVLQ